jgi:putative peptidoglycan lipid II flippase
VAFLIVPAAVAYLVLHDLLADAVTFGQMAAPPGQALVAACVAALAPGLPGYAALLLSTYACYARRDARSPLRAALLRAAVAAAGMGMAMQVSPGAGALLALGLAISAADIAGGTRLAARLRRVLPAASELPLVRPLLRTLAASVLMAVPAYLVGVQLPRLVPGGLNAHLPMVAATVTGAAVYFVLQWWWGSPELALIRAGLRPGAAPPGAPASQETKAPW